MKTISKYQICKTMLRANAEYVKVQFRGDKPMIRQSINDYTDCIIKDYHLSEYQQTLLVNYACKLHPIN